MFNILLQVLDDGRLTDGKGRTVDFKNTVIIMTSNVGSRWIEELPDPEEMRQRIREALRSEFPPEFLNRIDDIIIFNRLTQDDIEQIVDIQIKHVQQRLADRNIELVFTSQVRKLLATKGYDATFGARPLKRVLQQEILNPLAMDILEGDFKEGDTITIDCPDGRVSFEQAKS